MEVVRGCEPSTYQPIWDWWLRPPLTRLVFLISRKGLYGFYPHWLTTKIFTFNVHIVTRVRKQVDSDIMVQVVKVTVHCPTILSQWRDNGPMTTKWSNDDKMVQWWQNGPMMTKWSSDNKMVWWWQQNGPMMTKWSVTIFLDLSGCIQNRISTNSRGSRIWKFTSHSVNYTNFV